MKVQQVGIRFKGRLLPQVVIRLQDVRSRGSKAAGFVIEQRTDVPRPRYHPPLHPDTLYSDILYSPPILHNVLPANYITIGAPISV